MEKEYNGWTNYETWLLALNLNNSQATQEQALEIAKNSKTYEEFKTQIEEICYNEEKELYEIEDRWLNRDWEEINFYEVWNSFKEDQK